MLRQEIAPEPLPSTLRKRLAFVRLFHALCVACTVSSDIVKGSDKDKVKGSDKDKVKSVDKDKSVEKDKNKDAGQRKDNCSLANFHQVHTRPDPPSTTPIYIP